MGERAHPCAQHRFLLESRMQVNSYLKEKLWEKWAVKAADSRDISHSASEVDVSM